MFSAQAIGVIGALVVFLSFCFQLLRMNVNYFFKSFIKRIAQLTKIVLATYVQDSTMFIQHSF